MMEFEYNGAHHLWARNTRLLLSVEGGSRQMGQLWTSSLALGIRRGADNLPSRFLGLENRVFVILASLSRGRARERLGPHPPPRQVCQG